MTTEKKYPTTLKELQAELLEHSKTGRGGPGDAAFRLVIAEDNIGSFIRHLSHDQKENPTSRPHGTPASKVSDAGHAIVQFLTFVAVCDVDLQEAVNVALDGLRTKEFEKKEAKDPNKIAGVVAFPGFVQRMVWKPEHHGDLRMPAEPWNFIAVMSHPTTDARIAKFAGIVTDHGGYGCHAGIIARENGVPCVVGTGNATALLNEFDIVEMSLNGTVKKLENASEVLKRNTS